MAESFDSEVPSTSAHTIELILREDEEILSTDSAELDLETEIRIICQVEGEVHENHDLSFVKDGQLLNESSEDLSASLDIPSLDPDAAGLYECNVRRPNGSFQKNKLKLKIKHKPINLARFNEEECSSPNREHYCMHEGVCGQHVISKIPTCHCRLNYRGNRCEHYVSDDSVLLIPSSDSSTQFSDSSLVTGVGLFFLIALFAGITAFGYLRYKRRIVRRKTTDIEQFLHHSFEGSYDLERLATPEYRRVLLDRFPEPETARLMPQPKTPPTSPMFPVQIHFNAASSPTFQKFQEKAIDVFLPEKMRRNDSGINYASFKQILQRQKSGPADLAFERESSIKDFFLNKHKSADYSSTY